MPSNAPLAIWCALTGEAASEDGVVACARDAMVAAADTDFCDEMVRVSYTVTVRSTDAAARMDGVDERYARAMKGFSGAVCKTIR